MKLLSIYVDIRKSKQLNFNEKKKIFAHFYKIFRNLKLRKYFESSLNNTSFYTSFYIGDAVLLLFRVDANPNKYEIIKIIKYIDDASNKFEELTNNKVGIGISYGHAHDDGQKNIISSSIDGAAVGSNLGNKCYANNKLWKWVLPLKPGTDDDNSITQLANIIYNETNMIKSYKSHSRKNLWFKLKD